MFFSSRVLLYTHFIIIIVIIIYLIKTSLTYETYIFCISIVYKILCIQDYSPLQAVPWKLS